MNIPLITKEVLIMRAYGSIEMVLGLGSQLVCHAHAELVGLLVDGKHFDSGKMLLLGWQLHLHKDWNAFAVQGLQQG